MWGGKGTKGRKGEGKGGLSCVGMKSKSNFRACGKEFGNRILDGDRGKEGRRGGGNGKEGR